MKEKNKLYSTYICPAFSEMVDKIVYTYKFTSLPNIDCLKGLNEIEDNSINLIITSPPYNLGNTHHTGTKKHKT